MTKQALTLLLVCFFASISTSGKESRNQENTNDTTTDHQYSGATSALTPSAFYLKGILISQKDRSALVNDRIVSEGEQIGKAEVLEIGVSAVRIQVDSQVLSVHVGSTISLDELPLPATAQKSAVQQGRLTDVQHATMQLDAHLREITAKQGDTLSGIAHRVQRENLTTNQMMLALFEENPHAFADNINVLRAGAILRIPDNHALKYSVAENAAAEVARQTYLWRTAREESATPARLASVDRLESYGPVSNGETLSAIAVRVHAPDVTINQTMIALFEANPQAFGETIHVLREGAVLRIPGEVELRRQTPNNATAEVTRQTDHWQTQRQARLALTHTDVLTASHDRSYPAMHTPF